MMFAWLPKWPTMPSAQICKFVKYNAFVVGNPTYQTCLNSETTPQVARKTLVLLNLFRYIHRFVLFTGKAWEFYTYHVYLLSCQLLVALNYSHLLLRRYFTVLFSCKNSKKNIISKLCSWRAVLSGPQELLGFHPASLQREQAEPPPRRHLLCLVCSRSSSPPGLFQDPLLPIYLKRCDY